MSFFKTVQVTNLLKKDVHYMGDRIGKTCCVRKSSQERRQEAIDFMEHLYFVLRDARLRIVGVKAHAAIFSEGAVVDPEKSNFVTEEAKRPRVSRKESRRFSVQPGAEGSRSLETHDLPADYEMTPGILAMAVDAISNWNLSGTHSTEPVDWDALELQPLVVKGNSRRTQWEVASRGELPAGTPAGTGSSGGLPPVSGWWESTKNVLNVVLNWNL